MANFYESLEFDLPVALTERLVALFDEMPQGKLNAATIKRYVEPDAQGVYQLFVDGELVYIGKTDAEAGLGRRLLRHATKVASRKNLKPSAVTFKAVRVFVFTVMDLEQLLIKSYEDRAATGTAGSERRFLAWNHSGFGSNDPGRNRDGSQVKSDHFDALYPIDLDYKIKISHARKLVSVAEVLAELKSKLPYGLRFESSALKKKTPHADLAASSVTLSNDIDSVRNVLKQIATALGPKWQLTALPGYIIVYKEKVKYKHAMRL